MVGVASTPISGVGREPLEMLALRRSHASAGKVRAGSRCERGGNGAWPHL
jgi:hypothetical protein